MGPIARAMTCSFAARSMNTAITADSSGREHATSWPWCASRDRPLAA